MRITIVDGPRTWEIVVSEGDDADDREEDVKTTVEKTTLKLSEMLQR